MKIAVNKCYGGFCLSESVYSELGVEWDGYGYLNNKDLNIESDDHMAYRQDPRLINAIERLGEDAASGNMARVRVVEIPDDVQWAIHDYDGEETIRERHRCW
jgi:hypothetical protein